MIAHSSTLVYGNASQIRDDTHMKAMEIQQMCSGGWHWDTSRVLIHLC